jgi:hypothetical protein
VILLLAITDEALITVNSLEILGIIYLAIAISSLRSEISNLKGKFDQYTQNHKEGK